jgi:hypothetical protein
VLGAPPVGDHVHDISDLLSQSLKQARTMYDTMVSTYSRQVGQLGTTGEPGEAFLYVGPDDTRTRDFCADRVDKVFSREAIEQMDNGQLPDAMLTAGGYNCRHQFRRVSALDQELLDLVDKDIRYQDRNTPDAPSAAPVRLTDAEKQAVQDYSFGGGWQALNESLRSGDPLSASQQEMVRHLDSAIAKAGKLPDGTVVYRGVNFGSQGMPSGADLAGRSAQARETLVREGVANWAESTYKPGDTFQLGGFQSTSLDIQPALDASISRNSPGVVFEINAKQGLNMSKLAASRVDDEAEVLLSRHTTYRVDSVSRFKTFENAGGDEVQRTVVHVTQIFGGKK